MVSWPRVTFSSQNLLLSDVEQLHSDTVASLRGYFSASSPEYTSRFAGYSVPEVAAELSSSIEEHERAFSMSVLSALEAAFRIDYLQRCYGRKKDPLSRALRRIHRTKGPRASLEYDILEAFALGETCRI